MTSGEELIEKVARFLRDEVEIRKKDASVKIPYDSMPESAKDLYRRLARRLIGLMSAGYLDRFNRWVASYESRHNLKSGTLKRSVSEAYSNTKSGVE